MSSRFRTRSRGPSPRPWKSSCSAHGIGRWRRATPRTQRRTTSTCRGAITGTGATKGACRRRCGSSSRRKEKDPSFALPYSGLADALAVLAFYGYLPPKEAFPKSKAAAEAALRIDNTIAEAHASLAFAKTFYDWDWEGGDQAFATAFRLEPNYATAHWWYASALMVRGRPEDSDRELHRALEAEPLSAIITGGAAFHFYFRRQFEKGLEQAQRSLELDPAFGPSHAFQGWCHLELGHFEAAIAEWLKTAELMQNLALVRAMLGVTYARSGRQHGGPAHPC